MKWRVLLVILLYKKEPTTSSNDYGLDDDLTLEE